MAGRRPPTWYLVLMTVIGLQRLVELGISRANENRRPGPRAAARSYPLMVAAHVGLLTLPLLEVAGRTQQRPRWRAAAVLAAASLLRVWSISSLGRDWNVRATIPRDLVPVQRGPYTYIRHPNYLAVILEFAAIPLVAGAWRSALFLSALNAAILADRIRDEERLLSKSPAYRRAFAKRARFIPYVF